MRWACTAIATMVVTAAAAAPAVAMPDARNARPKVVSAELTQHGASVTVAVVGRDRDDVRGADISWGEGQPAQGLSACEITRHGKSDRGRRRNSKERFQLAYDYPAAGDYTITVRVYSGGCGKRAQQRSAPRTLSVHVG